ncbi:MAG: metal-dependent hydrolase [bacterium]
MAGYRGHSLGGAFAGVIVVFASLFALMALGGGERIYFGWWELPLWFALAMLGALWPDVDINSKGQTVFYALFIAVDFAFIFSRRYEYAAFLGLFAMLPAVSKHRGWTHSIWAMLILPLPFLLLHWFTTDATRTLSDWTGRPMSLVGVPYYLAGVAGIMSHLILDGIKIPLIPTRSAGRHARKERDQNTRKYPMPSRRAYTSMSVRTHTGRPRRRR